MLKRTWPLVAATFAVLIGAFVASGIALYRDYWRIYAEVQTVEQRYRTSESLLNAMRSEVFGIAILVRDYLLNSTPSIDREERRELLDLRNSLLNHVAELEKTLDRSEHERLKELRNIVQEYSEQTDSIFEWTPEEKRVRSYRFLTRDVVPFRKPVLKIAADIAELNTTRLRQRQAEIRELQRQAEAFMLWAIGATSVFGLGVAALVVWRTKGLEVQSDAHQAELEAERGQLRSLSSKLVSAQEEERKAISRELHDQIGQLLTGLKIELLHLEECRNAPAEQFENHMKRARSMTEETLKGVRDLATGLRPAVLDQLGLEPALRWQAREYTRLTGVPVSVVVDGSLDGLPDSHGTCAYRVVQEALTNCARHARPESIRICIHGGRDAVFVTVQDDGCGFTPGSPDQRGIGLIGMEERVSELGGTLRISSQLGKGTIIAMELPIAQGVPA